MVKKNIKNIDIILYALYLGGGQRKKVHTEDITLECFKLCPSRFSWIKHSSYPSLESVRRPLIDVRFKRRGSLVSGRHGKTKDNQVADGWIFTPEGINWIRKNKKRIESMLKIKKSKNVVRRTNLDKKIFELENSIAFKKFLKDNSCKNIKEYEFTDFLGANLDSPKTVIDNLIEKALAIAAESGRNKIINFIDKAKKHFNKFLEK
ncbi:hypothetical protein KKG58_01275 [Patescibacteria group bacterium]|nr:hypothetical protein [Patescibacteria group bacterium]